MGRLSRQQILLWLVLLTALGLFLINWMIPVEPVSVEEALREESPMSVDETEGKKIATIHLSNKEWHQRLSKEEYDVLREHGTESAFSSELHDLKKEGVYVCAGCSLPLFSSEAKYDSGTGWPSFWKPIQANHVGYSEDRRLFSVRTEVHCARCGGHLGHVFTDGPPPSGKRYCINGVALDFQSK